MSPEEDLEGPLWVSDYMI